MFSNASKQDKYIKRHLKQFGGNCFPSYSLLNTATNTNLRKKTILWKFRLTEENVHQEVIVMKIVDLPPFSSNQNNENNVYIKFKKHILRNKPQHVVDAVNSIKQWMREQTELEVKPHMLIGSKRPFRLTNITFPPTRYVSTGKAEFKYINE